MKKPFKQNVATRNFIVLFNLLKETKQFKTNLEFASRLNCSPQSLTEILKGRRNITVEQLSNFIKEYHIDPYAVLGLSQPKSFLLHHYKNRQVIINLDSLVNEINIHARTLKEGAKELKQEIEKAIRNNRK